jgi:GMP synthase (glutamine-hydrolysing)
MKKVVAIRHVAFENLGSFEPILIENGYLIHYLDAYIDNVYERVNAIDPDLLVVLGGPIGVYESEEYPFLNDEIKIIKERLDAGKAMVGICLGAQLIAKALGARVYSSGVKEIGWAPIELSPLGRESALRYLGQEGICVLHWHGDTFTLPEGAVHLASTPVCENQAFSFRNNVLGLQFHPEVFGSAIESWLVGHACEIANTNGLTVQGIRRDTQRYAIAFEAQARRFFKAWLYQAMLA